MRRLLGKIGVVYGLLALVAATLMSNMFIISLTNYFAQVQTQIAKNQTQNEHLILDLQNATHKLLNSQGNLSSQQRQILINQFAHIASHGGFATNDEVMKNQKLLQQINDSLSSLVHNTTR